MGIARILTAAVNPWGPPLKRDGFLPVALAVLLVFKPLSVVYSWFMQGFIPTFVIAFLEEARPEALANEAGIENLIETGLYCGQYLAVCVFLIPYGIVACKRLLGMGIRRAVSVPLLVLVLSAYIAFEGVEPGSLLEVSVPLAVMAAALLALHFGPDRDPPKPRYASRRPNLDHP